MKVFAKTLPFLIQLLLALCFTVSNGEAETHVLEVKSGETVIAQAMIDDAESYGFYSLTVDNAERLWKQWFWYRIGPSGKEESLETLSLKSVVPPSAMSPNTLSLTYSLTDAFDITVSYILTYPAGGNARMQKNVTITNTSAIDLDYHLFEYSDFDISDLEPMSDNLEFVGNKVYQNGDQADGSGVVIVHESTLPPNKYDMDFSELDLLPGMRDDAPSDLSIPQTTYLYGYDMQFAQQWDLTIPVNQSISFIINEDLYYTKPVTAAKTHAGCVTYGGQADYTITFDNIANSEESLGNFRIIDFLPVNTAPSSDPPAEGAVYDQSANSVTWSLATLAAGAAIQSKPLSITVNSTSDITNELLLVSDQAFPTRTSDPAVLCNHPPQISAIPNASINEGVSFSYQVVALDADTTDTLTYELTNAPAGMTISTSGLISYPVSVSGAYPVTVTVTDSGAGNISVSRTFTLTVNKVNHPPVISSTPVLTANDYQLYTYSITASDSDGDTLSYGLVTAPLGMSISGNLVSWTPTMSQTGNKDVTVVVNDVDNLYAYQSFTIAVTHVNRPPVISTTTLPPAMATVGIFYSYRIVASDPDGNLMTYSLTTKPTGMTIGTTGVIGWTPAADQNNLTHDVTVQVSDGQGGTASYSFNITVNNKLNPVITWATPAAITYGTPLSATQLNASANVAGTFAYTPAAGAVLNSGPQTLSVVFTPTDTTTYNNANKTVSLTVNKAAAAVELSNLSQTYDGSAKPATATTTPAGLSVAITYNGSATVPTAAGTYPVIATISDANYSGTTSGSLIISKATPVITWPAPAAIYTGSALTSLQLNATSSTAGTFVYTPVSGTVMNATGVQNLSVAFTPADAANYENASAGVTLTVNEKLNPVITWPAPEAITYGTALSATQLNASANVAGTFAYTPAAGAVLNAGPQTLSLQFTPSDTVAYNSATSNVSLTVNKATATVELSNLNQTYDGSAKPATVTTTPAGLSVAITYNGSDTVPTAAGTYPVIATISDANYSGTTSGSLIISKATPLISWPAPAAIYTGSALTSLQLNATSSTAGTFVYTPAAGTVMNAAGVQNLSVAFTPADSANYENASAGVTLTVNEKLNPVITWPAPEAITYGTVLSATQLNASANVAGTFAYTPAAGAVLNAGPQTLSLLFTPSDTVTYNSAMSNVSLTVNKATATVALSNLSQTYDGSVKPATVTTTPAGLSVAITYDGSATVPTAAGIYPVIATIIDANYSGTTSGSLIIAKATPLITWPAPAAIYTGSALTSLQLNATSSTAGTFVYTPVSGTVMNAAGVQNLSVAFTPADAANYENASAGVTLTVNEKLNPVITWPAPEAITYGTALSATQLNATANVAGTFTYIPAAGTTLNAGPQTLSLQFTPSDTVTYNSATSNVSLTVNKATATIELSNLSQTYDGSAKPATVTTTPAGLTVGITYDGSATVPTAVGTYSVIATISDVNYSGTASGTLTITAIVPPKMVRVMGALNNSDYNTLQEAYADPATLNGMTILAQVATFSSFTLDRDIGVTIKGGFDSNYQNNGDVSRIGGSLTVQKGSVVVENLVIQ